MSLFDVNDSCRNYGVSERLKLIYHPVTQLSQSVSMILSTCGWIVGTVTVYGKGKTGVECKDGFFL